MKFYSSTLAPCPLPTCQGDAQDRSTTATECVCCTVCGLTLEGANAVDRWNDRPARIPSAIVLGIYERLRAKHNEAMAPVEGEELLAVVEFANAVASALTPQEDCEAVNVGVGLFVHGDAEAAAVLRERLYTDPEAQVPEPLALLRLAEQSGFQFEGNTYRCGLADIAKLVAATKGTVP